MSAARPSETAAGASAAARILKAVTELLDEADEHGVKVIDVHSIRLAMWKAVKP